MAATPKDGGERDPAHDETEFDRFRDLAEKLVRVPKGEVDGLTDIRLAVSDRQSGKWFTLIAETGDGSDSGS